MKRREFITLLGSAAAWPLAARSSAGQQDSAVKLLPRVGVLEPYAAANPGYRMREALRDVGLEEGRNIAVEWPASAQVPRPPQSPGGPTGRDP
jgi:putative ABC transport system substrate-binding protein